MSDQAQKSSLASNSPLSDVNSAKRKHTVENLPSTESFVNVSSPKRKHSVENFPSAKSFVKLLRNELNSYEWKVIVGTGLSEKEDHEIDFETAFKLSIESELINPDLEQLCKVLNTVERHDIAEKIQDHSAAFHIMDKNEFHDKLIEELEAEILEEHEKWGSNLRYYTKKQNKRVHIIFDDDETVTLKSVFTNLTILKEEVAESEIIAVDSVNEIAYLRAMAEQDKSLETIDFLNIVTTHEPDAPKILCLTGNSGCGKTFLCKYIALLYGTQELTNFRYLLSIQCNNEEWHTMEKEREDKEENIENQFLRKFLQLGIQLKTNWIESLSRYLVKADGEGLLLILDGVDEFTKCVPFKSTLLFALLQRRLLTRATILITSRPGQWANLREEHAGQFKIDSNYMALGFSPSDRDAYFKKRMTGDKLRDTKQLFFLYDEINQLSLIPVNASLFSSLFNAMNKILSLTLTDLYTKLIVYIIRRQLSRMGLKKLTKVTHISQFQHSVLNGINIIGEQAYEGIFHSELSSREEDIYIRIDERQYPTERLGLMEMSVKVKLGQRVNVWTFAHLTLQEYMAAMFLSNKKWYNQCVITRFIVSSEEVFSMYRMVVRFVCGILTNRAACLIPIICSHLLTETMELSNLPSGLQLCFDCGIVSVSGWLEFTKFYLCCISNIVESKSRQINEYFKYLEDLLPEKLHLNFKNFTSPNDWHCFVFSLNYINKLETLVIRTSIINPDQFSTFLDQLSTCSLVHLALIFCQQKYEDIQSYTSLLSSKGVPFNYKISITFRSCELLQTQPTQLLFAGQNQFNGSLQLCESKLSNEILEHLTNQFSLIDNLSYAPKSGNSEWPILKNLIANNSQINGLFIRDTNSYLSTTPEILRGHTSLQELCWHTEDAYSVLPYLASNKLSYLSLFSLKETIPQENVSNQLSKLIYQNNTSFQSIELYGLDTVGFNNWTTILTPIQSCSNLVFLSFSHLSFVTDDISKWSTAIECLQALVALMIIDVPIRDPGLMILCKSLNRHPSIRNLKFQDCSISYISCEPITMLIHTLPYIKQLSLHKPELTKHNPDPLMELEKTAEHFLVNVQYKE